MEINDLLKEAVEKGASDLHISVGTKPIIRVDGSLVPIEQYEPLSSGDIETAIDRILREEQRAQFDHEGEIDLSYGIPGVARFRVNIFRQRGTGGLVARVIPSRPRSIGELNLPDILTQFCMRTKGLVLVTGPTGSGKSTTLAAMISHINRTRRCHIITLEDPIEYLYRHEMSIVNQREVGNDTRSFSNGLRAALREDPDVILIGEMRDLETISTAIHAAETGHLVFGTLHTNDATQTVDRIIDAYPPYQQQQIRVQLSLALEGVVSQQLIPLASGKGRVAALEIMVMTQAIRNLVREGKTHQIYSAIQTGGKYGMQTMDYALRQLYMSGTISLDDAMSRAAYPQEFGKLQS